MKIAIVQGAFYPVPARRGGAVEKIWFALGREFARRGHEVTHYSRLCDGLPAAETLGGVRHVRVPGADFPGSTLLRQWHDLRFTRRVARRLDRADVVVTNTFWAPLVFSPVRHGPLWVHVQRYPRGQMRLYRHAARLQTVSRTIAEAIVAQLPSALPRVRVIPNPLPPPVAAGPVVRDPALVLFVGRIHPEKGIHLLVAAAALARRLAPGLRFEVVGPSETRFGGGGPAFQRSLDEQVARDGAHVTFAGPVFDEAQLAARYAAASVFVYPSLAARGEASPVAPLEALARGCPVVTSDLACFDDTVGRGAHTRRFDHRPADAGARLLAAIAELLRDRRAWDAASTAAADRAGGFSVGRIAGEYLAGFAELARSRP